MLTPHPLLDPSLPVLDRDPRSLQVGAEPDHGLVLQAEAARLPLLRRALAACDGHHSPDDIAHASGLTAGDVDHLLAELARHRLLRPGPPARPALRVIGSGTLARAFTEAWTAEPDGAEGSPPLELVDPEPPAPGLYADPRPTGAESLRQHLHRARGHRARVVQHWSHPTRSVLTVLAVDRLECDRAITDTLLREDRPHLLLRPVPGGVRVGPLVVPGETSCTRCSDLVRAQDPAFPRLLAQLCRRAQPVPPELAGWAAHTALLQVRAWASGDRAECLGATLEVRQHHWRILQRTWPPHPDCGCAGLPG